MKEQREIRQPEYDNSVPLKLYQLEWKQNEECFDLHWHESFEILRIVSGSMSIVISGGDFSRQATAGDIIIIMPYQLHYAVALTDISYDVFMFEKDNLINSGINQQTLAAKSLFDGSITLKSIVRHRELSVLLDNIVKSYQNRKPLFESEIFGTLLLIITFLWNNDIEHTLPNPVPKIFYEIQEYISNHFCEPISTATIAKYFYMEESYLCKLYKEYSRSSIMQTIRNLRLENSKNMLISTDKSLLDISSACGFSDINYFIRCFSKKYGIPPKRYRTIITKK